MKHKKKLIHSRKGVDKIAGIGKKTGDWIDKAVDAVTSIPDKIDAAIKKAV